MHRTTPKGVTGPGGVNTESGPQTVRLTLSHAGVYNPTTEPLNQESNSLKKWLMLALPVVAGAAAGAGIAAAREPAVREKYPEGMTVVNDPARTPISGENLYTYTDKDGVTKGIYLSDRMVDAARITSELPRKSSKEGTTLNTRRPKRSFFGNFFDRKIKSAKEKQRQIDLQKQEKAKAEQLLRENLARGIKWTRDPDHYSTPTQRNSPDHKPEGVVTVDLSKVPTQAQRHELVNQEPDYYYFQGSPERDINFPRFNFKFDTTANNTLNEYLRYVFQQYGNGLSYAEVLPNDIYVKYSTGGTGMFVTPQQLVTNQVDTQLKQLNGSVLSIVNMAASSKEYTFPDRYPAPLQDKLKGGGFWQDVKATMKAQLADTEVVSGYKSKIRKNAELSIRLNAKGDITQEKVDRKMNKCQPVQYKGRTVAGMFIVPGKNDRSKGRLYSLNPQFKAVDIVFNKDISYLLDTALEKEIAFGFTGSSQEKNELFISGNKLNPNGIPKFHAWGGTRKNVEDFLFDITTNKLHDDLDAITVSDGEQALMNALEITKWGMVVISAPLGPKGAAVAALISSLASTLQAQIVERSADSERYMQEALWELAFAGIGHAAGDLLGNVAKNVLRKISNKIDETIDAIKARPTSLKQHLDEFHNFVDIKRVAPINDKLKVTGVDLSDIPAETTGINSGTYKKGDNYYIKQGNNIFEVFLDKDNNTLRLRNPDQPRNGGYHPPVRLNKETNSWETHSEVGLQGGGKTWGNARHPQGMANKMKPDYSTIGQPDMGKAPSIQRSGIKNGQWANSKGTLSTLDDNLKVMGIDLSGVQIEKTGSFRGTYKKGEKYYIQQDSTTFEVFQDQNNNTLRLKNSSQPRSEGNHPPVRLNTETNSWETYSEVELQGGGKTDNARPHQGLANRMEPDYNTIGQHTKGQAPAIKRPEFNNGQWVNAEGTITTLDDNLKVVGIDLSGVQVERMGTFRGTYKKDDNYYIKQDNTTFEVFLDQDNNTLRLKNPNQPRSGENHPQVRFNTSNGNWEV
ncbi:hypothetical protein [Serratia quinivorans]|uniref:hypothetical protein n=1 Tax=Serratia quinivorans TaxID=137545 RepID=UPI002179A435|nr:hypothetical protein [Serratia quinivorans]CAI1237724.1 Uncharacterised protein [Serratia quinivorans]